MAKKICSRLGLQLLLQGEPQTPKKSFITPGAITDVPTHVFAKLSIWCKKSGVLHLAFT